MNRAQRRKISKQGINAKTLKVIERRSVSKGKDEGMSLAVDGFSVAVAYVMHYKMGYGERKCLTTMKQIHEVFEQMNRGELNIQQMEEDLLRDIGLRFTNDPDQP